MKVLRCIVPRPRYFLFGSRSRSRKVWTRPFLVCASPKSIEREGLEERGEKKKRGVAATISFITNALICTQRVHSSLFLAESNKRTMNYVLY